MYAIPSLRGILSSTQMISFEPFYAASSVLSVSNEVNTSVIKDDFLYIGGVFDIVGKISDLKVLNFGIINTTTAVHNSTINKTLFNDTVHCCLISGNYIYVGGTFTAYNNQPCERLAKISLIDGSLDTTFDTTTGFNSAVYSIVLDNSGNLYVGGAFTTYKGVTRQRIAKLNASTAVLDTTFDTTTGFSSVVYSIAIDNSGNIYAGGSFTTYKSISRQYITKLNGIDATLDTTFDTTTGFDFTVYTLALDNSGNIYVGGGFTTYKSVTRQRIAKLNASTALLDTTFDTTTGFDSVVYTLALDNSGNIYVGGDFGQYKGIFRGRIAKLNASTAVLDTTFDTIIGFNATVRTLVLDNSGNLYVGGDFSTSKGVTRQRIAKLNASNSVLDTTFDTATGFSTQVRTLVLDNSGNLYVGGDVIEYKSVNNSVKRNNIAKFSLIDGSVDTMFDTTTGFNNVVYSIAIDNSGNLYVGGDFTTYKGIARQRIAKLNGIDATLDTTFDTTTGFNNIVYSIVLDNSGNIYVGGFFGGYKSVSRQYIAKLNASTAVLDTTFDTIIGFNGAVYSIAIDNSGNIYAGGSFTTYKGVTRQRIAKLNASTAVLDTTFDTITGFNNIVYSIVLDNSGNIYAGGSFTTYKGVTRQRIAKVNASTAVLDTTFDTITGFSSDARTLVLDNSGNLYVGGTFTAYKGVTRQRIAKLNASTAVLDTTFDTTTGFNSIVKTLVLDNSGNIYVGGVFIHYKKSITLGIAKLDINTAQLDPSYNDIFL